MRKVLITGATGFVGSHALEAISADGTTKVIAACRNQNRLPQEFKGEIKIGDIREDAYMASLFEDVDTVCNADAVTPEEVIRDDLRQDLIQTPVEFTHGFT